MLITKSYMGLKTDNIINADTHLRADVFFFFFLIYKNNLFLYFEINLIFNKFCIKD